MIPELVRDGPVMGSLSERPSPSWVSEGYANNPSGQRAAIARWSFPVTSAAERERALRFVTPGESFACTSCARFAFPSPRRCFWCQRGHAT